MLLCLLDFLSWKDTKTRILLTFWRYMSGLLESDLFFSKVASQSEGLRQKRMKRCKNMQKIKYQLKKKGFDIQPPCAWMRLPPWRQQPRSRVSDQTLACWNIQDCIRTGRRRIDKMTARKTTWNAEKASQRPLTERNGAFMHGPFAGALSAPFLLALFCHCDAELFQCKPPHFSVCGSFF